MGGRLARWMMYLQQFNFKVEHRPGRAHGNADALSRQPPTDPIISVIQQQLGKNLDDLQSAQLADPDLARIITALSSYSTLPSNIAPGLKNAFLCDGLLCRNFQESSLSSTQKQVIPLTKLINTVPFWSPGDTQNHGEHQATLLLAWV